MERKVDKRKEDGQREGTKTSVAIVLSLSCHLSVSSKGTKKKKKHTSGLVIYSKHILRSHSVTL